MEAFHFQPYGPKFSVIIWQFPEREYNNVKQTIKDCVTLLTNHQSTISTWSLIASQQVSSDSLQRDNKNWSDGSEQQPQMPNGPEGGRRKLTRTVDSTAAQGGEYFPQSEWQSVEKTVRKNARGCQKVRRMEAWSRHPDHWFHWHGVVSSPDFQSGRQLKGRSVRLLHIYGSDRATKQRNCPLPSYWQYGVVSRCRARFCSAGPMALELPSSWHCHGSSRWSGSFFAGNGFGSSGRHSSSGCYPLSVLVWLEPNQVEP